MGPVVERFSSPGGCYYTPHQFIQQGRHRTIFGGFSPPIPCEHPPTKKAKPPPKSAAQSIPVESGEHVQEFKVNRSRTKKFYTEPVKE